MVSKLCRKLCLRIRTNQPVDSLTAVCTRILCLVRRRHIPIPTVAEISLNTVEATAYIGARGYTFCARCQLRISDHRRFTPSWTILFSKPILWLVPGFETPRQCRAHPASTETLHRRTNDNNLSPLLQPTLGYSAAHRSSRKNTKLQWVGSIGR